jgi:hypothetical protein
MLGFSDRRDILMSQVAVQELSLSEIETVSGAQLSATQVVTYTLIGAVAIGTGGTGLVIGGTFLIAMTAILA